jgi:indolepyruvate ferredoxin oxidoreductase alpha subunit
MSTVWVIAWRELKSMLVSPVAWAILGLFLFIYGAFFWIFLAEFSAFSAQLYQYAGQPDFEEILGQVTLNEWVLRPLFGNLQVVFLLLVPALTMRLFSEEKKQGTYEFVLTSPVSVGQLVAGKYLAGLLMAGLLLLASAVYPAILYLLGEPETAPAIPYVKDSTKRVMIPGHARLRHPVMVKRLDEMEEFSEEFPWQRVEEGYNGAGVVTSGVAYQYVKEAFPGVGILKLAMTNPLPGRLITEFCSAHEDIYVVEELEPFLEEAVAALGFKPKGKERVPRVGELNVDNVRAAFPELSPVEPTEVRRVEDLPARPPILCAGCPHRGIMYVLARLKAIIAGDIGCYTLSVLPPLSAHDCQVCMGASITMGHGLEKALELAQGEDGYEGPGSHRVVSVLGDSTFFHSGVTGLMEMAYNNGRYTVVILDNRTTAMTGFQHHPGTGITLQDDESSMVDMEMLARALGIQNVRVVDPYDLEECRRVLTEEMNRDAPSVVISRRECILKVRDREPVYYQVVKESCNDCGLCMGIACPALVQRGDEVVILPDSCTGCGVCAQVCNREAIRLTRR